MSQLDLRQMTWLEVFLMVALGLAGGAAIYGGLKYGDLHHHRGYAVPLDELLEPGVKYRLNGEFLETEGRVNRYVTRPSYEHRDTKYPLLQWFIVVDGVPLVVEEKPAVDGCRCDQCGSCLDRQFRELENLIWAGIPKPKPRAGK
jgi:hypothetical protein